MNSSPNKPEPEYNKPVVRLLIIGVAVAAVAFGIYQLTKNNNKTASPPVPASNAASSGAASNTSKQTLLYLSPASGSYQSGNSFTVSLHENSGSTSVNAVQANISYPADKLSLVSQDYTGTPFQIEAKNTGGNGSISIVRGVVGGVSGDNLVANFTFKATGSGTANLSFTNGSALLTNADNKNLVTSLSSTSGASYNLQ